MQLGMIGLGRMGMNMAKRLLDAKHEVVAFNRTISKVDEIVKQGAIGAYSIEEFVEKLKGPRIIWLMLPTGDVVKNQLQKLLGLLNEGDIVIEGGNSYYKEDLVNFSMFKEKGIHYLDAGVSGGIWGYDIGYCTMVGGEEDIYQYIKPILDDLAPKNGHQYCGEAGSGHFVKMVHNGIEYALMEAYGEGFEILKASRYSKGLNLEKIANLWNQGSVIRSWLLELLESAFSSDNELENISGYVSDSGEARFTLKEAIDTGVSAPIIAQSLFKRFQSRQQDTFSDKVVAALRKEFGGHAVADIKSDIKKSTAGAGSIEHSKSHKK